ncbi:hypothetical protein Ciccas_002682, partial [Cichlidogyrus casuarinus]
VSSCWITPITRYYRIAEALLASQEKSLDSKDELHLAKTLDGAFLEHLKQVKECAKKRRYSDTEDDYVSSADEQRASSASALASTRSNSISPMVNAGPTELIESELSKALDAEPNPPETKFQELYAAQKRQLEDHKCSEQVKTDNSLLYNLLISRDENNNKSSGIKSRPGDGLQPYMSLSKLLTEHKKSQERAPPQHSKSLPPKPVLKPKMKKQKSNMKYSLPLEKRLQPASMPPSYRLNLGVPTTNMPQLQIPNRPGAAPAQNSVLASLIGSGSSGNEASPISSDSGLGEMPILDLLGLKILQHQNQNNASARVNNFISAPNALHIPTSHPNQSVPQVSSTSSLLSRAGLLNQPRFFVSFIFNTSTSTLLKLTAF